MNVTTPSLVPEIGNVSVWNRVTSCHFRTWQDHSPTIKGSNLVLQYKTMPKPMTMLNYHKIRHILHNHIDVYNDSALKYHLQ